MGAHLGSFRLMHRPRRLLWSVDDRPVNWHNGSSSAGPGASVIAKSVAARIGS